MLERYKLRLNDGTVLVVDHDALSSWLVDGRSAAWRNPAPETPVPVTPPRPRDDERAFRPVRIPPLPPISQPPSVPVPTDEAPVPSFEPASLLPTRDEEVSITVPVAEEAEAAPPPDLSPPSLAPEPVLAVSEPPSIDVPEEEPAALYAESPPPTTDEEVSITVPVAEEPPEVWVPSEEAAALYSESFPPAPENAPSVVPLKLLDEEDVTPWR